MIKKFTKECLESTGLLKPNYNNCRKAKYGLTKLETKLLF